MKKFFLTKLNVLLGAASLSLIGCHTAKNAAPVRNDAAAPVRSDATPERMYGPPMIVEPAPQKPYPEPLPEEPAPAPAPDEPTPVKYGVPWNSEWE